MRTIALFLALASLCYADDVLLKDGRRIEFKSLEDTGDAYTIVTPEGSRVIVKRAEVDGFAKTEPATLLTGATMSFGKGVKLDTVDLLKKIEDKDFLVGLWKIAPDGALTVAMPPKVEGAFCQIRYMPSFEEYNLTLVVERLEGSDNISIAFPTPGGGQCQFYFDIDCGKYSAILVPGGPDGHTKASTAVQGKQFSLRKPRTVTFLVRKTGLAVQLDGKDVSTAKLDWSRIVPLGGTQGRDTFVIGALTSGIRISKATVTVPK